MDSLCKLQRAVLWQIHTSLSIFLTSPIFLLHILLAEYTKNCTDFLYFNSVQNSKFYQRCHNQNIRKRFNWCSWSNVLTQIFASPFPLNNMLSNISALPLLLMLFLNYPTPSNFKIHSTYFLLGNFGTNHYQNLHETLYLIKNI